MNEIITPEILKLILPVLIFQFLFQIGCVVSIVKKGVKNLTKPIWITIVLLTNILGPIAFMIWGRNGEYND